jgi:uncharacterized membrane protein
VTETATRAQSAWGNAAEGEPRWPASLALLVALALYVTLPYKLTIGPPWTVALLELALIVPLSIMAPRRGSSEARWHRVTAIFLIAVINAANFVSLILLVHFLLLHGSKATAAQLLFSSLEIWLTNIIVFALWYWELDRGGPTARASQRHRQPDFLFPQMVTPGCAPGHWYPRFMDYLYLAFTNATAFSPTDTLPLTAGAKLLMLVQALTSLLTVALVAARAVNILA